MDIPGNNSAPLRKFRARIDPSQSFWRSARLSPPPPCRGRDRTGQESFANVRLYPNLLKPDVHIHQCLRTYAQSPESITAFNSRRLHHPSPGTDGRRFRAKDGVLRNLGAGGLARRHGSVLRMTGHPFRCSTLTFSNLWSSLANFTVAILMTLNDAWLSTTRENARHTKVSGAIREW